MDKINNRVIFGNQQKTYVSLSLTLVEQCSIMSIVKTIGDDMKVIVERTKCWDGTASMKVVHNDGGRASEGWKGNVGDCVVRSIAIATETPYQQVYDALFEMNAAFMESSRSKIAKRMRAKGATPRNGNFKHVYRPYLESLGWEWIPTMKIGSGCKVHLCEGELPAGRIIARVSKHLCAVIDGVIHDTFDPQWATIVVKDGKERIAHRCVYGYFRKREHEAKAA